MKKERVKLWKVTVNDWTWDNPKTIFARSKEEAEEIASRYPAHDDVRFAGSFLPEKAEWLLSDSIQPFAYWLKDKSF